MSTPKPEEWQAHLAALAPELRALDDAREDVFLSGGGRLVPLAELLSVLTEQVTTPPGVDQLPVRQDRYHPGLLAAAWRHTVFRQARAVLVLFNAGLQVEARANAQACLEHAVTVRRLALAADADELGPLLDEMAYQEHHRQELQLKRLEDRDTETGGVHRAMLQTARREHEAKQTTSDNTWPKRSQVKRIFEGVPEGLEIYYGIYGLLSESTHAGLSSASGYLMPTMRTGSPLPAAPETGAWAETAALLCWSCWAAEDAMLRFINGSAPLAARQVELLARINLAPE